jgi:hypothetical protein
MPQIFRFSGYFEWRRIRSPLGGRSGRPFPSLRRRLEPDSHVASAGLVPPQPGNPTLEPSTRMSAFQRRQKWQLRFARDAHESLSSSPVRVDTRLSASALKCSKPSAPSQVLQAKCSKQSIEPNGKRFGVDGRDRSSREVTPRYVKPRPLLNGAAETATGTFSLTQWSQAF